VKFLFCFACSSFNPCGVVPAQSLFAFFIHSVHGRVYISCRFPVTWSDLNFYRYLSSESWFFDYS
jgi:hypothetical protein